MQALFRVDSSSQIGGGHLSRCLTLAMALQSSGYRIVFACADLSGHLSELVTQAGFQLLLLPPLMDEAQDALQTQQLVHNLADPLNGLELLVLDHYQLGARWQTALLPLTQNLCVIDDLAATPIHADVIVNQNAGAQAIDYQTLATTQSLNSSTQLLMGPQYALLRSEFQNQTLPQAAAVTHCLIQISATDPDNVTLKVISALLKTTTQVHFSVVLSSKARHLQSVQQAIQGDGRFSLHLDVHDMATFMAQHQVAIGAGGVAALERCAIGLPCLLFIIAANQNAGALALETAAAVQLAPTDYTMLGDALDSFIANQTARQTMAYKGQELVDACGANRVATTLTSAAKKTTKRKYLIQAQHQPQHRQALFDWNQVPQIRQYSRTASAPSWEQHVGWYDSVMHNPDRHLYFVALAGQLVGMVRLDQTDANSGEISIITAPNWQQQGVATAALRLIRALFPQFTLNAFINHANAASQVLFENNGYLSIGKGWFSAPPKDKS